jgi:protein-arginine kinase activator protein McsA
MFCERCHENPGTVYVTSMLKGQSAVQNFCEKCYDEILNAHSALAEALREEGRGGREARYDKILST